MLKLTHIINPVKVSEASDLFFAQPVTFKTMQRAKQFAVNEIEVNLITTQYPEDHSIIPEFFAKTKDLDRSVLDFGAFEKKRKLPLLKDILDRAVDYDSEADYIIYTNVDIAVQPHFYSFVKKKIVEGYDAFVINRRTIPAKFDINTIHEAYSEIGEKHPGFDCFVLKTSLLKDFKLGKVCIGTTRIGLVFIANLIMHSKKFKIFKEEHLTFHIGEDKVWQNSSLQDYVSHNEIEAIKVLGELKKLNNLKFEENNLLMKYYSDLTNLSEKIEEKVSLAPKRSFFDKIIRKLK